MSAIRAVCRGCGQFLVSAQRKAWHTENWGFLRYSAGVGEDNPGPFTECKEIQMFDGIKRPQCRHGHSPALLAK